MPIAGLIDKQDTAEIVRDKIAAILISERDAQKLLATAGGKDPALWDFAVYRERAYPWSAWQNDDMDVRPIVNVWFDGETFDGGASNIMERQTADGRFNVDVYARGLAADVAGAGHLPGDLQAAESMHRVLRLVRNILMAAEYSYLDLRGTVGKRWPVSVNTFQPQQDNQQAEPVVAARLVLGVRYNEFAPQAPESSIELIASTVTLSPSGEVVDVSIAFT